VLWVSQVAPPQAVPGSHLSSGSASSEFITLDSVQELGVKVAELEAALHDSVSSHSSVMSEDAGRCMGALLCEYRRYSESLCEYMKATKQRNDSMKVRV
jgi:hypothetical protein